MEKEEEHRNIN
jgi:hypothetical protein